MGEHHDHEVNRAIGSARKNKVANKIWAVIKLGFGFFGGDPVLASEGGHDLGDNWAHSDHIEELKAPTFAEGKIFATKSAVKVGVLSVMAAAAEYAMESRWNIHPKPLLNSFVSGGSLATNTYLWWDARQHTIASAHSLQSHTKWDLGVAGVTFGNAILTLKGVNVNPVIPIAAHVGLGCAAAWDIHHYDPVETQELQTEGEDNV